MRPKFRPATVIFLTLMLFATACGPDNSHRTDIVLPILNTPNPNIHAATSELCNNVLNPSKQGAAWVYSNTGGPGGTFIYTNSITEVWEDGFTLTSQFADFTGTQKWSCQPDGLKALQLGGGSAAGISLQGMTPNLTASDVIGISLPQNVTSGMQWQYSLKLQGSIVMPGDPQAPASGFYSVVMQEMGRETVTVPAGTFEAVKIQYNSTVDIISSFAGAELPIKFNGTTITWYAPGVGYVKSVENGGFGGESYSTTTELLTYSIP